MSSYRVEWASDPMRPERLDRWCMCDDAEAARRAALEVLSAGSAGWVRVVLRRTGVHDEPGSVDVSDSFPDRKALLSWNQPDALPVDVAGTAFRTTPAARRLESRFIAAITQVADWGISADLITAGDARSLLTYAVMLLASAGGEPLPREERGRRDAAARSAR